MIVPLLVPGWWSGLAGSCGECGANSSGKAAARVGGNQALRGWSLAAVVAGGTGSAGLLGVAVHFSDPGLHEFLADDWVHGWLLDCCWASDSEDVAKAGERVSGDRARLSPRDP
jgi:hypothetical protein